MWRSDPYCPAAPSCARAVDEAAAVLRAAGHTVVPFVMPEAEKAIGHDDFLYSPRFHHTIEYPNADNMSHAYVR